MPNFIDRGRSDKQGRTIAGSEVEYTDDELAFLKAVDTYKRENRRPYPTWSEVLEIAKSLGYRKVAEPDV